MGGGAPPPNPAPAIIVKMATQVYHDEDGEDEASSQIGARVAEFWTLAPGQDPDITPLSLPGDGPWEFSAGRDAERDIVIDDAGVSGHHADICAPATPRPAPPNPAAHTKRLGRPG